jgi:hypothetical protein
MEMMILKEAQKKQKKPTMKIPPMNSIPKLCHKPSRYQRILQQSVGA